MPTHVAYQGAPASFSDEAILRSLPNAEGVGKRSFAEVGRAVLGGLVECGLLPLENSLHGTVGAAYDVLASGEFEIGAEVVMPIRQCILGIPGARVDDIRTVHSHPVALSQCTGFLERYPQITPVEASDTAGAARDIATAGDRQAAAIASTMAAKRYGLAVLAGGVQNRKDNQTRFALILPRGAARPEVTGSGPARRMTLLVDVPHEPGALAGVLVPLSEAGLNLTKIEGRPGPEPWTYRFLIEIEDVGPEVHGESAWLPRLRSRGRVTSLGVFPRLPLRSEYRSGLG